jgi:serine/threonine protein phosphatase PrpC
VLIRITVSRSLGDTAAQSIGVFANPDCSTIALNRNDRFIILASDGLTDGIIADDILQIAKKSVSDPQGIANELIEAGLKGLNKNQVDDNISTIVVSIKDGGVQ